MGDSEQKIEYTPQELAEIERIIGLMPSEGVPARRPPAARVALPEEIEETLDDGDLRPGDEEGIEAIEEIEDISDAIEFVEEEPAPVRGRIRPAEDVAETLDISALEPFDEGAQAPEAPVSGEGADILPADEFAGLGEMPEIEEAPPRARKPVSEGTLGDLEELTAGEPPSVDLQDIPDSGFAEEPKPARKAPPEDELGIGDLDEIPGAGAGTEARQEVRLDKDVDLDIGDLSDISVKEISDMPEVGEADIPEFGAGEIPLPDETAPPGRRKTEEAPQPFEEMPEDMHGLDIPEPMSLSGEPAAKKPAEPELDVFAEAPPRREEKIESFEDFADSADLGAFEEPEPEPAPKARKERAAESFDIEPLPGERAPAGDEGLDLSSRELSKLKKALMLFHPALRRAVKDTIMTDRLPVPDARALVDLILKGGSEEAVKDFLEGKLGIFIDIAEEAPREGRRVISARPEYTKVGIERQKKLFKATRVFAIVAAVTFLTTVLCYQFIYKPYMAKKLIREGVAYIREKGDPVNKKPRDYEKAEKLFRDVDEHFIKNYIPGYNAYARAYFDKHEYDYAIKKLENAIELDPVNVETLNNLGYFYARVPDVDFKRLRRDKKENRLDLAIKYYRMVLTREPENQTALYGVGNAYFYQGHYLKAKQYYEDMLRINKKSAEGHAGLLNLYIERDVLPEVVSVHVAMQDKDLLEKAPSPLLYKLANYYLGKKRTDKVNIRLDYGIQSNRFKDLADNPYPAVRAVLSALHQRDPDYPPLYVAYARLNRDEKNLTLMESYLQKALKLEPAYFAALHLLGEYYYMTKQPVKSYDYLNKAVQANLSPPEFAMEDFYKETETVGRSYHLMGNIFYYFFDQVKATSRFGDELEEEEDRENEIEQRANYEIAQTKYEAAADEGYKAPELSYNLGRIFYLKQQYEKALEQWLDLYEDFVENPEIMFALGNAFYHMDNIEAARGEYLKLINSFERKTEKIKTVFPDRADHLKIYGTLASAYNNMGSVFHRKGNETKASVSYWKAIDNSRRLERENEFARVNLARLLRPTGEPGKPVLDESIPFSIQYYIKELRP
ncbi:MAG: tetratricopeptide repeat protein [Spirochaetes bacterium]|nr:MAG: tetratricopeptide repeat protein [Spirochaetota bacterium]